jgi:hypothetical protein
MPEFKKSTREGKKYMAKTPSGRWVHFGNLKGAAKEHYKDSTGLGLYSHLDHNDPKRRISYRKRHGAIKLKSGKLAVLDPEQPAFYSWRWLW